MIDPPIKQKYDKDRREMYPPIIQDPIYSVIRKDKKYFLSLGERVIKELKSESEHGAIREANIFINDILDF